MTEHGRIRRVIIAGLLLALTLLLALIPGIGFIPVPTPAGNATIVHIPAIIGGILEGSLVGLVIGLGFGFASLMRATIPAFKDPLVAILPRLFIGLVSAWVFSGFYHASKRTLMAGLTILVVVALVVVALLTGASPGALGWLQGLSETTAGSAAFTWWQGGLIALIMVGLAAGLMVWLQNEDRGIVATALATAVGSLTNTVLVLGMATLRGYFTAGMSLVIALAQGIPEMIVSVVVVVAVVAAVRQFGRRKARL
ncbi:MAG: ECF transporter S component [Chloroflexi bacterium]|nr:ECF transporter S component [Chloroflexota bacterium]